MIGRSCAAPITMLLILREFRAALAAQGVLGAQLAVFVAAPGLWPWAGSWLSGLRAEPVKRFETGVEGY